MSLDSEIREIVEDKTKLEEECWGCREWGRVKKPVMLNDNGRCDYCDGTGIRLTEFGRQVLEFVKSRFHLLEK